LKFLGELFALKSVKITIIAAFFWGVFSAVSVRAELPWFDPAYLESGTMDFGSGFILVPSAEVMPHSWWLISLHRYQAKAGVGLYGYGEAGLSLDVEGYRFSEFEKNNLFFAKVRLLDREKHFISLAVGAEGVGLEDLGAENLSFIAKDELKHREHYYVVAGRTLPWLSNVMLTAGWGDGARTASWFGNLAWVVFPGLMLEGEYDGIGTNLGIRMLLSTRIKMDVAVIHTQFVETDKPFSRVLENNVRFGISYVERWP
jgi:hypothetical protein